MIVTQAYTDEQKRIAAMDTWIAQNYPSEVRP